MVVTEASQKGIWTHGHLYGNRSRYVFSTYYRLGFRLLGLSCVLVQTHHLHRPKAHLRSLCCFKSFAKAEKSECYFNSPKVEAGQWVTGHYWMKDKPHHIVDCSLLTGAKITLWPSISSSSSQARVTSENSLASLSSPKEELTCRDGKVIFP